MGVAEILKCFQILSTYIAVRGCKYTGDWNAAYAL